MSGAVWTVGAYMDALKANLIQRLEDAGELEQDWAPEVLAAPVSDKELPKEAIVLIRARADEEAAALGGRRNEEEYVIEGAIQTRAILGEQTPPEAAAKEARDRALVLLGYVEAEVRLNPNQASLDGFRSATVVGKTLDQLVEPGGGGRICVIGFDVRVKTRTSVTGP